MGIPEFGWCHKTARHPAEVVLEDSAVFGAPTPARSMITAYDRLALSDRLGKLLQDAGLAKDLETSVYHIPDVMPAIVALAEQSVRMGIDYASLGLGWSHPRSRKEYRLGMHESIMAPPSQHRREESRRRLVRAVQAIVNGAVNPEDCVTSIFVSEIGLIVDSPPGDAASFKGVKAALAAELLLPLRALCEGLLLSEREVLTINRLPVPRDAMRRTVHDIVSSVLSSPDGFTRWRYSNNVGQEQLRGLTRSQLEEWQRATNFRHTADLRTHEDAEGELGFFWATKIGGPSHGFDYEGHCLLPLLANARHKVLLVSDPTSAHLPSGRCHWRLVWTADRQQPEPRLWLEALHTDFGIQEQQSAERQNSWHLAVLTHALTKANLMGTVLSVGPHYCEALRHLKMTLGLTGSIWVAQEFILLRPSNGVVEASDELSAKHDWCQGTEEVTDPGPRAVYVPCKNDGNPVSQPAAHWILQDTVDRPSRDPEPSPSHSAPSPVRSAPPPVLRCASSPVQSPSHGLTNSPSHQLRSSQSHQLSCSASPPVVYRETRIRSN